MQKCGGRRGRKREKRPQQQHEQQRNQIYNHHDEVLKGYKFNMFLQKGLTAKLLLNGKHRQQKTKSRVSAHYYELL